MEIIDKIKNVYKSLQTFSAAPVVTKEPDSAPGWLGFSSVASRGTFVSTNAYQQVVWAYAAVNAIVQNIVNLPMYIRVKGQSESELDRAHPLVEWITEKKVNPLMNFSQALEGFLINKLIWGESFFVKEGNWRTGHLEELWVHNPTKFEEKLTNTELVGWDFSKGEGSKVSLSTEEVVFSRRFNPYNEVRGLSPLAVAAISCELDYNSGLTGNIFFKNGSVLPGVITVERNLTDAQYDRLVAQWDERYAGKEKSFRPLVLEGKGTSWTSMTGAQNQGTIFPEIKKLTREEIAAIYRVPPSEVGVFQFSNYANAAQQDKNFWVKTLIPEAKSLAAVITEEIVGVYDENLEFYFDFENVSALQVDMKMIADVAKTYYDMKIPVIAINDRLGLGFKEADLKPKEDDTPDTPEEPSDVEPPVDMDDDKVYWKDLPFQEYHKVWFCKREKISKDRKLKHWDWDKDRQVCNVIDIDNRKLCSMFFADDFNKTEVKEWAATIREPVIVELANKLELEKKFFDYFKQMPDEFTGELTDDKKRIIEADIIGAKVRDRVELDKKDLIEKIEQFFIGLQLDIEKEVITNVKKFYDPQNLYSISDVAFDEFPYQRRIKEFFEETYAELLIAGFTGLRTEIGKGFEIDLKKFKGLTISKMFETNFDPYYDEAIAMMQNRLPQVQGVTKSINKQVSGVIREGIEKGWGIPKTSDKLRTDVFGDKINKSRANRIADTEAGIAMNTGRHAELNRRDLGRRWVSAKDEAVRPDHAEEHARMTVIKGDAVYPVTGLRYPCDPGGEPGQIIYCRCVEVADSGEGQIEDVASIDESIDDKLTLSGILNKTEKGIKDNHLEHGYLYDKQGKLIFHKIGDANSIPFTKEEIEKMQDGIFTHNHPGKTFLSYPDINLTLQNGLAEMRAVAGNKVYVFKNIKKQYTDTEINQFNSDYRQITDEIRVVVLDDYTGEERTKDVIKSQVAEKMIYSLNLRDYGFTISVEDL